MIMDSYWLLSMVVDGYWLLFIVLDGSWYPWLYMVIIGNVLLLMVIECYPWL